MSYIYTTIIILNLGTAAAVEVKENVSYGPAMMKWTIYSTTTLPPQWVYVASQTTENNANHGNGLPIVPSGEEEESDISYENDTSHSVEYVEICPL